VPDEADGATSELPERCLGVANESRGEVQVTLDVIRQRRIPYPRIEKPDSIVQMYAYCPLENAVRSATIQFISWSG